jgi:hypothetical protein
MAIASGRTAAPASSPRPADRRAISGRASGSRLGRSRRELLLSPLGDAANGRGQRGAIDGSHEDPHGPRPEGGSCVSRRPRACRQAREGDPRAAGDGAATSATSSAPPQRLSLGLRLRRPTCVAGYEAVHRLVEPADVGHLGTLAAAGAIGFAGNRIAALIRGRAGRRLDSPALIADGARPRRRLCLAGCDGLRGDGRRRVADRRPTHRAGHHRGDPAHHVGLLAHRARAARALSARAGAQPVARRAVRDARGSVVVAGWLGGADGRAHRAELGGLAARV